MSQKTKHEEEADVSEEEEDDEEDELVLKGAKTTDIQEEYTVQAVFGSGGFSTVYTAVDNANGDVVAIKHIVKFREEPDRMMPWELHKQYLVNEVETLLRLSGCPNVVQLYDIYEDAGNIFMVFELIDGEELFDMICANGYYPEPEAVLILRAVCRGLKACHDRNVMHRDIKPENIMCPISDKNAHDLNKATIIDFGLAAILEPGTFTTEASGSPGYVAPEILVGCPYDRSVDLWSLGVTAYILLAGYPPWVEDTEVPVEDQIIAGDYEFHSPEWDDVSDLAKDWIKNLLVLDPTKRMTVSEALQHTFLKMSVAPASVEVAYSASKPSVASRLGKTSSTTEDPKAKLDLKGKVPPPKAEAQKPETPKPETPKPETPKPETPKAETPKHHQPEPKPEKPAPAVEIPKPEKPEKPKPEQPKPEQPKPEQPKPESVPVFDLIPEPIPVKNLTPEPPQQAPITRPHPPPLDIAPLLEKAAVQTGKSRQTPRVTSPRTTVTTVLNPKLNAVKKAAAALTTAQETSTQGTAAQGTAAQGTTAQGTTAQGTTAQRTPSGPPKPVEPAAAKLGCPKCGDTSLASSARFCGNCGGKLEVPASIPPASTPASTPASIPPASIPPASIPASIPPAPIRTPAPTPAPPKRGRIVYKPPDHIKSIPVNREVAGKNVSNKYVPPDHTKNIPVLREIYDPETKSGRTVRELVQESPSLRKKVIFPKLGNVRLGKLRGKLAEDVTVPIGLEVVDPATSNVIRYIPATTSSKNLDPPALPKYVQPDHVRSVPVVKEVAIEGKFLPKYVPPDHITHVPVNREAVKEVVKEKKLPKYVPPDHITHVPIVKEVADIDNKPSSTSTYT